MKKKSRLLSSLLSLALLVGALPTAAFAANEQIVGESIAVPVKLETAAITARLTDDSLQAAEADVMKINDDMELLYTYGVVTDEAQVQKITISNTDEIIYLIEIANYENEVSIHDFDGGVEMHVKQGNISNILEIYDNRDFCLDGKLIDVSYAFESAAMSAAMPRSMEYWQENVPFYGTASSYSYTHSSGESIADIDFMTTVSNIAVSAFVSIFVGAMTAGASIIVSIGASALSGIGTSFYQYISNNDPYSTAASYIATSYTIKNGTGYIDQNYGYQYKYDFSFYTRKNFGGTNYKEIWYYMILPTA